MNMTHASSALLRWLGAVSTVLLPGLRHRANTFGCCTARLTLAGRGVRAAPCRHPPHHGSARGGAGRRGARGARPQATGSEGPPVRADEPGDPGLRALRPARHERDPAHADGTRLGKLGLAEQVERARTAAAGARADDVRWEERSRAAMAFYELYETDQSIAVVRQTQRLLRDLVTTTTTMYAVGEARQPDVLRAQVELARMTEEIVRLEAMRAGAAARLNAVLDRPAEAAVPSPVLPSFSAGCTRLADATRSALAHRPMLRAGGEDVHAAEAAERLAGREIWPDLTLGVQYGWRPMDEGTDHMLSLMLGFRLPIWAGSRQLAMRRETQAMREMASADLAGDEGHHPQPSGRARGRGASRPDAPPSSIGRRCCRRQVRRWVRRWPPIGLGAWTS